MAITLDSLNEVTASDPPRILIYGVPGVGKSTLANEFPNAIFLQCEEGTPAGIKIRSFGHLETFPDFMEAIKVIATNDTGADTVVVDTIDALQGLVHQQLCAEQEWNNIEDPGYGKGYAMADDIWAKVIKALNWIRKNKKMNIVLLAHSDIVKFDPPGMEPYNRYTIRLHKRASGMVLDECDAVAFMNYKIELKKTDTGFNKKSTHAEGGGTRYLYWEERPAHVAKNRYGLEDQMMVIPDQTVAELAKHMPLSGMETS